jgi:hypothetical protein
VRIEQESRVLCAEPGTVSLDPGSSSPSSYNSCQALWVSEDEYSIDPAFKNLDLAIYQLEAGQETKEFFW